MSSPDSRPKERVLFLKTSPLFLDLHTEEIALLSELCQPISFSEGEFVFRQDDPGDCLYIVQQGEVEIAHEDGSSRPPNIITRLGRGEFFGEMSMLEKSTRSATVRTVLPSDLLTLTTEDFYSFAKIFRNGFTVVIINIARILSQRLRHTTGRLRAS